PAPPPKLCSPQEGSESLLMIPTTISHISPSNDVAMGQGRHRLYDQLAAKPTTVAELTVVSSRGSTGCVSEWPPTLLRHNVLRRRRRQLLILVERLRDGLSAVSKLFSTLFLRVRAWARRRRKKKLGHLGHGAESPFLTVFGGCCGPDTDRTQLGHRGR